MLVVDSYVGSWLGQSWACRSFPTGLLSSHAPGSLTCRSRGVTPSSMGHHLSHSGSLCAKWIQCRSTIRPNHNSETGRPSELPNETTTRRAHTVTPREGSAYKPLRPLKSST